MTQHLTFLDLHIVGPMERKTISQGYFEIQCNVPESSRGEITWLKDGQVFLIPSNRPVYFRNGKRTIVFESVAPEDNGLYTCIINNQYQTSASTDLYIMDRGIHMLTMFPQTHYASLNDDYFTDIGYYFQIITMQIGQVSKYCCAVAVLLQVKQKRFLRYVFLRWSMFLLLTLES